MSPTVAPETIAGLSPEEQARLDAILQAPEPLTFRGFVDRVNPEYRWYWHCEVLAERLQEVVEGRRDRLMVFMPPRHGKSELVGRLLPAYYLYRYPRRNVGITSYGARLAERDLSHDARRYYREFGGEISEEASAKKQWENTAGGEVWSAGVDGSITGSGFHLGIIDDPVKNAEEARSETQQQNNRDWYDSTFYTRREPENAIVIVQTRWNEGDLSGWLLDREEEEPERWHVIHYQGIRRPEDMPEYPETVTVEEDPRERGHVLCSERRSLDELTAFEGRNPYYFAALVQGTPRPREGGVFQRDHFETLERHELPQNEGSAARYWDRASTSGGGSYTVGVKARWYRTEPGEKRFVIEDVVRGQWGTEQRERIFSATIQQDGDQVKQWIEQEPGSSGKDAIRATSQRNPQYPIEGDKVTGDTGDKEARADPLASWGATNAIYMIKAPWNEAFVQELTGFPNAKYDDQVDGADGAFRKLVLEDTGETFEVAEAGLQI